MYLMFVLLLGTYCVKSPNPSSSENESNSVECIIMRIVNHRAFLKGCESLSTPNYLQTHISCKCKSEILNNPTELLQSVTHDDEKYNLINK